MIRRYRIPILLMAIMINLSLSCAHMPDPVPSSYPNIEKRAFCLINDHRRALGLRPLLWNEIIAGECRKHSRRLSRSDRWLGHDGFEERARAIGRWIRFTAAGENLASNSGKDDPAAAALRQWLNSPTHRMTLEDDFNITGIGVEMSPSGHYYFTQIFIRPLSGSPGLEDFPDYRETARANARWNAEPK